jgi:predicted nucleic acid-binding protein
MTSSIPHPSIVVDANIAIRAILPFKESGRILEHFSAWHQSRRDIYAPDILLPESVSVIWRSVFNHWITEAEGIVAVEDLFRLGISIISSDPVICQAALAWANRLGGSKAYDGFYLAVADLRRAELWTADEKLYNRIKQLGLSWVRWVEEEGG